MMKNSRSRTFHLLPLGLLVMAAVWLLTASSVRGIDDDDLRAEYEPESEAEVKKPEQPNKPTGYNTSYVDTVFHFEQPETVDNRPPERRDTGPEPKARTFGVIVDCGSSGTRAHIYSWDTEFDVSLQMLHNIEPVRNESSGRPLTDRIFPGLHTFANSNRRQRVNYIRPLMEFIKANIPNTRLKYTGVYFMATAGMRLISELDRQSIMSDIKEFVQANYKFAYVETSVISGKDEGMYQWVSVNAKGKRFLAEHTGSKTKTYAVIEMGGASIQVTYKLRSGLAELVVQSLPGDLRPTYWKQLVEPEISRSGVLDHNFHLHSTTFLGLGVNSAREAYLDLLIHEDQKPRKRKLLTSISRSLLRRVSSSKSLKQYVGQGERVPTFEDPCLPAGYETPEPLEKPMRLLKKSKEAPKIGYNAEEKDKMFKFNLIGSGDFRKCKRLIGKMLRVAKKEKMLCTEEKDNCTMSLLGEKFVPFPRFDFVAIGGFNYALRNSIINSSERYNHFKIACKIRKICAMSYNRMDSKFGKIVKDKKILSSACFRALWVDTFLVKGLKMPKEFSMLELTNSINNNEVDWTLGAILDKSFAIERATENMNSGSL